jgi:hypothetical protein
MQAKCTACAGRHEGAGALRATGASTFVDTFVDPAVGGNLLTGLGYLDGTPPMAPMCFVSISP